MFYFVLFYFEHYTCTLKKFKVLNKTKITYVLLQERLIQCIHFFDIACEIYFQFLSENCFYTQKNSVCVSLCVYKCHVLIFWKPTTFHRSLTMQFGGRMSCCSAVPFMLALSCRAGARHCNPESTLAAPSLNEPFICEKPPKCVKITYSSSLLPFCRRAIVQLSWLLHAIAIKLQQTVTFQRLALECLILKRSYEIEHLFILRLFTDTYSRGKMLTLKSALSIIMLLCC